MNLKEQTLKIIEKIKQIRAFESFKDLDEMNSGMGFILIYLLDAEKEVYATEISEKMHISRARIAMLVKKLISKGLLLKEKSTSDARKELIKLSDCGQKEAKKIKAKIFDNISKVVNELGIEKVEAFIETSQQIRDVMCK